MPFGLCNAPATLEKGHVEGVKRPELDRVSSIHKRYSGSGTDSGRDGSLARTSFGMPQISRLEIQRS